MNTPTMHHYVPRWYLERFADVNTGFLFVLDLQDDKIFRQKPNKIMRIRDYYKQDHAPDGIDKYIFEDRLTKMFDNIMEKILDKLIYKPEELTDDCMGHIVVYLTNQRLRVPRQINTVKINLEKIANIYAYKDEDLYDFLNKNKMLIEINDGIKFDLMRDQHTSMKLTYLLTKMIWRIFKSPDHISFITTDSPVSFYNHMIPLNIEARIDLSETIVYFPLSSHYLLEIRREEANFTPDTYKNHVIPTEALSDGHTCIEHAYKVRESTTEEVMQINYIMTILADRFVVADSRKLFEFLQEAYFPK